MEASDSKFLISFGHFLAVSIGLHRPSPLEKIQHFPVFFLTKKENELIKSKQWSFYQTAYMWWWYTSAESDNNMREPWSSSTWCGTCLSTTRPYSPDFGEAATTSTSPQHLRWLWCNWCHHSGHCHQVRKALLDVDVNLWKFYDQWVLKKNVWPLVWQISLQ